MGVWTSSEGCLWTADPYLTWFGRGSWSWHTKGSDRVTSPGSSGSAMAVSAKFSAGKAEIKSPTEIRTQLSYLTFMSHNSACSSASFKAKCKGSWERSAQSNIIPSTSTGCVINNNTFIIYLRCSPVVQLFVSTDRLLHSGEDNNMFAGNVLHMYLWIFWHIFFQLSKGFHEVFRFIHLEY